MEDRKTVHNTVQEVVCALGGVLSEAVCREWKESGRCMEACVASLTEHEPEVWVEQPKMAAAETVFSISLCCVWCVAV